MKRFWSCAMLPVLFAAVISAGQTATLAPAIAEADSSPVAVATAAPTPFGTLRAEALAQLLAGDFRNGSASLKAALASSADDEAATKADQWVSEFLTRRDADAADRKSDYDAAVTMAQALLAIAQHADELADAGETDDTLADVRKQLADVRETIVDLLAAPRIEENVTSETWYVEWLTRDRAKISETFEKIRGELADDSGRQAEQIRKGMVRMTAALDAFAAEAGVHVWGSHDAAERSLDSVTDQTEVLAMAMDDLTALVSESPWRAAVERLRLVQEITDKDSALLTEPWAEAIVAGAVRRAEAHEQDRKWYDALTLYETLHELYEYNGQYEERIKYVTRRARVMSLYSLAAKDEKAPDAEDGQGEAGSSDDPAPPTSVAAGQGDSGVLKVEEWRERVRGVDGNIVHQALVKIEEAYVETVDYRKALLGALRAIRVLAQSPEVARTFEGLADEQARAEFLARVDDRIKEASGIEDMTYRMVGRSLDKVLWANRVTVQIPDEVLYVEFTDGLMKELDRFSTMIWPSDWPEFRKHTMGSFKGVGIQIQVQRETGLLLVVSPLENSPAYRAGIKAGDFIMKIDGTDAKGIAIEEAVKLITGPEDTEVVLTIKRPGLESELVTPLRREEIRIHTVKGWKRSNGDQWDWFIDPDNRVGYVRMTSFNHDTSVELRQALDEMRAQGVRGLILDLRGNPGGLLAAAVEVVNEFVGDGTIVSTKSRKQRTGRLFADKSGNYLTGELVILIDDRSASAAEIVSGALKDLGRAVIVGQRSFGKGSVQNLIPIRQSPSGLNDTFLKVTTAYYYLPSERCLHRTEGATEWGVEPDVQPVVSPRQMRRWLTLLRRTEIIKHRDQAQLDEDMALQFRADIQLDAALLICRLRLLQNDLGDPVVQTEIAQQETDEAPNQ